MDLYTKILDLILETAAKKPLHPHKDVWTIEHHNAIGKSITDKMVEDRQDDVKTRKGVKLSPDEARIDLHEKLSKEAHKAHLDNLIETYHMTPKEKTEFLRAHESHHTNERNRHDQISNDKSLSYDVREASRRAAKFHEKALREISSRLPRKPGIRPKKPTNRNNPIIP